MLKEAILIAGGAAVHEVGKVIKLTGEKINEVQKEHFNKVVEQSKKEECEHEQIWVEEEIIKKRKLLEEKVYHQFSFYNMENILLYLAREGIIREKRKAEIHNGSQEKLAMIEETGDSCSGEKRCREYSIFLGGARIDVAQQVYEGEQSCLELKHKKWKVYFEKNNVRKIVDGDGFVMMEVETKIGKRCLLNIYTDEQKMCVLLYLAGTLNRL